MSSMISSHREAEYDINELDQEAKCRWLKPAEVHFILQNHEKYKITQEPPRQPQGGSLFLFNKRVLRFFRRDGHNWRKKKDGRTVGEAHERLKVGNVETLNCYYAHGEDNNTFQRRSYWMLDPAYEHIVLVHYRDITEGGSNSVSFSQLSPGSLLSFSQSPSPTTHNAGSISVSDYQSLTSPRSSDVSSVTVTALTNEADRSNSGSSDLEVSHALRKLEEQLSLNDDTLQDFGTIARQVENSNIGDLVGYNKDDESFNRDFHGTQNVLQNNFYSGYTAGQGGSGEDQRQYYGNEYSYERKESLTWKDVLDSCNTSTKENDLSFNGNEPEFTGSGSTEEPTQRQWQTSSASSVDHASPSMCQEVNSLQFSRYPSTSAIGIGGTDSEYYGMMFNQGQIGEFESDVSLTVAQKQKFKIKEISPGWGFASESTKIIIVGSFLCDSSESTWNCMFGDVEVPVQIIQDGVLRCEAPPLPPGKVTLCVTSGNRESCSEIREFEYRPKPGSFVEPNMESSRSPEDLLFLVRFVQTLLSDSPAKKRDVSDADSYASIIEALSFGGGTSAATIDWLLERLLEDKLMSWVSSKSWERHGQTTGCPLSKKEQGIIHLAAGLGFEWALNPILSSGVSVDFRDIKGWTALHWAARLGREKMVAALIASGASAGAVTDPSSENRTGDTAASIAAKSGHKGLAGYLSEVALTSHLSSLTLGSDVVESELSRGSAEVAAEITVNNISTQGLGGSHGDHVSLRHTLAAVRNAAQAAARIQSAFRAHSFRRRQGLNSGYGTDSESEYNIQGLSAVSKLGFRNSAALSIQKKYRGYKGRKDFLTFRQNVVKIQACVRGYQVRKHYKVICWAVGVLEKVVLRWRRKGHGLRGFRPETEINDSEDEDILKSFRKQKVDGTINQAITRVLSMVKSSEARQQYHRVLEKYCQAKAELGGTSNEAEESGVDIEDFCDIEDINMYPFTQ